MDPFASITELADSWWVCVLHSTWQSSLVVLLAFAVVWLRRKRSASFLYAVLVVALLKFLVPPIIEVPVFESPVALAPAVEVSDATRISSDETRTDTDVSPTSASVPSSTALQLATAPENAALAATVTLPGAELPLAQPSSPVAPDPAFSIIEHWKGLLALLHLTGAGLLALVMAGSYLHLRRLLRTAQPANDELSRLANEVAARLRLRRPVAVLLTSTPCAPMATGLFKRRILLPEALTTLDDDEMRAVLAHELAHHRRMDLAFIWIEHVVTLLWWFNPLVWLLVRAIHRIREDCCDDVVLSLDLAANTQYCKTLLQAAKRLHRPFAPHLVFGCASKLHPLGQRITRIMDTAIRRRAALTAGGIIVVALMGLVLLPTYLPVAADADPTRTNTDPTRTDTDAAAAASSATTGSELRGVVHGVVSNGVTGEPVSGAFVAIDHSGDAGGSNLERFNEEGLYVTAETDAEGRFALEGVALRDGHPFYVTAPGFVRHDDSVSLTPQRPEQTLEVRMRPGATIVATCGVSSDERGAALTFRLSAKDEYLVIPPRGDWPERKYRIEPTRDGSFTFTDLAPGQYTVEAILVELAQITYVDSAVVGVAEGDSKTVELTKKHSRNGVSVSIALDPYQDKGESAPMLILCPAIFDLDLLRGHFVHPEDDVLGRFLENALIFREGLGKIYEGDSTGYATCVLDDMPPGAYTIAAFTVGKYPNFESPSVYPRWTNFVLENHKSISVSIPWTEPRGPYSSKAAAETNEAPPKTVVSLPLPNSSAVPPESQAVVDALLGEIVFKGTYFHRSRGSDLSAPSVVWIKRTKEGETIAASYLPAFNDTSVAYVSPDKGVRRYEGHYHGRDGQAPSARNLDMAHGVVTLTHEGGEKDGQTETLSVPATAIFMPNSRPDSYTAHMGIAAFQAAIGLPVEPAELVCYDWDNSGKGMASYTIRMENKGKEEVTVPAGTFSATHYVETHLTFGDTWYKKRPGHVTDYWVLDNGAIVRILRHREPYELQLLSVETPAELPGYLGKAAERPASTLRILSAVYGAQDSWVDLTEVLSRMIQNDTLEVRVSNELGGDPIYGTPKKLNVHYRVGEKTCVTSVDELGTLRLPESRTAQPGPSGALSNPSQGANIPPARGTALPRDSAKLPLKPIAKTDDAVVFDRNQLAEASASLDYADVVNNLNPQMAEDENGNVTGITSDNFASFLFAREIGLQNGDVINTINGVQIDSDQKLMEIFQKFAQASTFRLGITRNGEPVVLTFQLQ